MNVDTDHGVTEALQEIASWYAPDRTREAGAVDELAIDHGPPRPESGPRIALVAVVMLVTVGAVALVVGRWSAQTEPAGLTATPSRATIVDLCLDIESGYDLEGLAATGTVHTFGGTGTGEVPLVISSGVLHAACGLAQRDDGEWFRIVSLADTHLPLAASDDVSVLVAAQLGDRTYVAGQVGTEIDGIRVLRADGEHDGQIDAGWWGVSFYSLDDLNRPFPPFSIRSTTTAGDSRTERGSDLLVAKPWSFCAQDDDCRDQRLLELQELARASESTEQAAILADGIVTEEEHRSALRAWGGCIAQATGAKVTFDDSGLFTIHESGDHIDTAFERCKASHIALVIEASGLAGAGGS